MKKNLKWKCSTINHLAEQKDGMDYLLHHLLEVMMRVERKEYNETHKFIGNGYGSRKSFGRKKIDRKNETNLCF